jgi:hypothetical protein
MLGADNTALGLKYWRRRQKTIGHSMRASIQFALINTSIAGLSNGPIRIRLTPGRTQRLFCNRQQFGSGQFALRVTGQRIDAQQRAWQKSRIDLSAQRGKQIRASNRRGHDQRHQALLTCRIG